MNLKHLEESIDRLIESLQGPDPKKLEYALDKFIQENDPSGSYCSGYCMDLALSLGQLIEDMGGEAEYWELGSDGEPQVHVMVVYQGRPYEATLSYNFGDVRGLGDFYTDTEVDFRPITKKEIISAPWTEDSLRSTKEYKIIKENYLRLLRSE
jgi:hypothetical protein